LFDIDEQILTTRLEPARRALLPNRTHPPYKPAVGLLLALALALTAAPNQAQANHCPGAAQPRATLLCLVNHERAEHGLKPLRLDAKLRRAAERHARDMARRRYFAHERPGGPDLTERLRRAGWRGRGAGEVIAYGCESASSARTAVRGWMLSPPHRAILLDGRFRRAGPGMARRPPVDCGRGATWVLDVGRR
jgi:uncharacterized protein YkwD